MSKSCFRILINSFADFRSDILSLNSNFNLINHLYPNLLSSGVLFVKSEITTIAFAMLQGHVAVSCCIILSVPVPMWQCSVV